MIALMIAPMFTNVFTSWSRRKNPRAGEVDDPAALMIGCTKLSMNVLMTAANAVPMTTATARSTTFPRIRKSLKPLITCLSRGWAPGGAVSLAAQPWQSRHQVSRATEDDGQPVGDGRCRQPGRRRGAGRDQQQRPVAESGGQAGPRLPGRQQDPNTRGHQPGLRGRGVRRRRG